MSEQGEEVMALVERIKPLLAGHPPEVQSAALADLTAMWLAGYQDLNKPDDPELLSFREGMFKSWCDTVRDLVPVNSAMVRERFKLKGGSK